MAVNSLVPALQTPYNKKRVPAVQASYTCFNGFPQPTDPSAIPLTAKDREAQRTRDQLHFYEHNPQALREAFFTGCEVDIHAAARAIYVATLERGEMRITAQSMKQLHPDSLLFHGTDATPTHEAYSRFIFEIYAKTIHQRMIDKSPGEFSAYFIPSRVQEFRFERI